MGIFNGKQAGGEAWSTTLSPAGTYYYSSISHYYHNPSSSCPALLKMDLNGNVVDIYDLVNGYQNGGLSWSTFLNDTVIAGSAGWGNTEDDIVNHAILFDTVGSIINYTDLVQDIYSSILQITFDGKLVYMYNTYQNSQFDVYLRKLNQNLEDDTLYTQPFTYDSLCPYQIISDTISQEGCGLIVGDEEIKQESRNNINQLIIFPNPATKRFIVKSEIPEFIRGATIEIFDLYGQKIKRIKVSNGVSEVEVVVKGLQKGLYLVRMQSKSGAVENGKVMVQ